MTFNRRIPGRYDGERHTPLSSLNEISRKLNELLKAVISGSSSVTPGSATLSEQQVQSALLTSLLGVDYSTESTLQSVLAGITANGGVLTSLLNENKIDFELASVEDSNGDIFKLVFEKDETTGATTISYIDAQGNAATPVGTVNFLNPVSVLTQLLAELQNLNLTDFSTQAKQDDIIAELQNILNEPDYEVLQCFGRDSDALSSWTMVPGSQSTTQIIAGSFTPPLLGIVPSWDSIVYSGFNNAFYLEVDVDVDFSTLNTVNILADFTYTSGVSINDITVELIESSGNTVVATSTGLVGVPLGTTETINLIYDNSVSNFSTFKIRLTPNAVSGSYTISSNNWNYITAAGITDPAELIIRRVDKYEDNVLQSTEYFDYQDVSYTLIGTFLKDSSLESTSLVNSILANLFNLDVPLSTRASESTLLEVKDYILKTPSKYYMVWNNTPGALDVTSDFELEYYDNSGVQQTFSDGGAIAGGTNPYPTKADLINVLNALPGCPVTFADPTPFELSQSLIFIEYAIEIQDGTVPASQVIEMSEFTIDGEDVLSDISSVTPCITGFDRISEEVAKLSQTGGNQNIAILNELQTIRDHTEFDTETISWQPMCVDGVQWYFADSAIYEFGQTSVDNSEPVYKQGDNGPITSTRPTGTVFEYGSCSAVNVRSIPSYSGITFDSDSPDVSLGGGFFGALPAVLGGITFTLTSGKVISFFTDGSTTRVQTLQDFCDIFNTHVSAFSCNVASGTTLVIEEAKISPSSIAQIVIVNDDGSSSSTYTTFSLASPDFDNLDLIRRDLQDTRNEIQILSRECSILRNVATTVTTTVVDFSDTVIFGNIDDVVGAIITVKNGTLYSVIQPGTTVNDPVTLGVPVSSGASVHIGKTPEYLSQDENEVLQWKGATDSGTADIIVQFYKYKI